MNKVNIVIMVLLVSMVAGCGGGGKMGISMPGEPQVEEEVIMTGEQLVGGSPKMLPSPCIRRLPEGDIYLSYKTSANELIARAAGINIKETVSAFLQMGSTCTIENVCLSANARKDLVEVKKKSLGTKVELVEVETVILDWAVVRIETTGTCNVVLPEKDNIIMDQSEDLILIAGVMDASSISRARAKISEAKILDENPRETLPDCAPKQLGDIWVSASGLVTEELQDLVPLEMSCVTGFLKMDDMKVSGGFSVRSNDSMLVEFGGALSWELVAEAWSIAKKKALAYAKLKGLGDLGDLEELFDVDDDKEKPAESIFGTPQAEEDYEDEEQEEEDNEYA